MHILNGIFFKLKSDYKTKLIKNISEGIQLFFIWYNTIVIIYNVLMLNNGLNHHVRCASDLNHSGPRGIGLPVLMCEVIDQVLSRVHHLIHKFGNINQLFGQSYSSRCIYQRWERERAQLVAWSTVELVLKLHPADREANSTWNSIHAFKFNVQIVWVRREALQISSVTAQLSNELTSVNGARAEKPKVPPWSEGWTQSILQRKQKSQRGLQLPRSPATWGLGASPSPTVPLTALQRHK